MTAKPDHWYRQIKWECTMMRGTNQSSDNQFKNHPMQNSKMLSGPIQFCSITAITLNIEKREHIWTSWSLINKSGNVDTIGKSSSAVQIAQMPPSVWLNLCTNGIATIMNVFETTKHGTNDDKVSRVIQTAGLAVPGWKKLVLYSQIPWIIVCCRQIVGKPILMKPSN